MGILSVIPRPIKLALKSRWKQARVSFAETWRSYQSDDLLAALRSVGIHSGDSVMLHSAFGREYGYRGSADSLTDVFVDAVGPTGHLLMVSLPYRSASIDYIRSGRPFDVRHTPSMMGIVSELFRRRDDVIRSLHPTHPILVRGPRAQWFVDEHPDCLYPCGPGTPFDRLAEVDGKAVFFNVPFDTYTFFHYLEHLIAPHLPFSLYMNEPFTVPIIDRDGRSRMVTTFVFAPEAIRRRRFAVLDTQMRRRGLLARRRIGNGSILAVRVRDTIDCVHQMKGEGRFFYEFTEPLALPKP
ncbi:MAG: AAC(3) family N-acetyltransferase [Burkholderiales bacterium]